GVQGCSAPVATSASTGARSAMARYLLSAEKDRAEAEATLTGRPACGAVGHATRVFVGRCSTRVWESTLSSLPARYCPSGERLRGALPLKAGRSARSLPVVRS